MTIPCKNKKFTVTTIKKAIFFQRIWSVHDYSKKVTNYYSKLAVLIPAVCI